RAVRDRLGEPGVECTGGVGEANHELPHLVPAREQVVLDHPYHVPAAARVHGDVQVRGDAVRRVVDHRVPVHRGPLSRCAGDRGAYSGAVRADNADEARRIGASPRPFDPGAGQVAENGRVGGHGGDRRLPASPALPRLLSTWGLARGMAARTPIWKFPRPEKLSMPLTRSCGLSASLEPPIVALWKFWYDCPISASTSAGVRSSRSRSGLLMFVTPRSHAATPMSTRSARNAVRIGLPPPRGGGAPRAGCSAPRAGPAATSLEARR